MLNTSIATKLPAGLVGKLDEICEKFGLRKNFVIEQALKEKIEDLLDTFDLKQAISEPEGFESWESVKKQMKRQA